MGSEIAALFGRHTQSLVGWDAKWYWHIAAYGYAGVPAEGLRFFPVMPLAARWLGFAVQSDRAAVLLIANGCALAYALLAYRLARASGLSERAAGLVPWVIGLAPTGFVLVMGYSEALFGILITATLLAGRSHRWAVAAVAGLLAGALRPTGILLALPVLIEALRGLPRVSFGSWLARTVAVAAPGIGLAAYLGWVWARFGDPLLPFHVQERPDLRAGVLVSPVATLRHAVTHVAVPPFVHLAWIAVALVILVACARRLPPSYTAFSAATVFLAVTARDFNSFERYTASAVPLLLVVAQWLAEQSARRRRVLGRLAGVVLFGYALAAFTWLYIP